MYKIRIKTERGIGIVISDIINPEKIDGYDKEIKIISVRELVGTELLNAKFIFKSLENKPVLIGTKLL